MENIFSNFLFFYFIFYSPLQPVGFIGLGNMGLPMARNLVAKGHKLVLYDISQERMNEVGGGEGVGSPAEVASKAETVITMLPTGNHVMQCYSGENGLLRFENERREGGGGK